jgi:hypothetical protein
MSARRRYRSRSRKNMETSRLSPGFAKVSSMRLLLAILLAGAGFAADPITPGKYSGKWQGAAAGGDFLMTISRDAGAWKADVSFRMGDDQVKCTVTALSIEGSTIHVVYTFDLMGNKLESTIDGERAGAKLSGKYKTRAPESNAAVDQGTWEASPAS